MITGSLGVGNVSIKRTNSIMGWFILDHERVHARFERSMVISRVLYWRNESGREMERYAYAGRYEWL